MRSALRRDCGLEIAVSLMEKIYGRRVSQFKEAALLESHQGMCKQRKNKQQWCSEKQNQVFHVHALADSIRLMHPDPAAYADV